MRNARPWHLLDAAQAYEYVINHALDKVRVFVGEEGRRGVQAEG